MVRYDKNYPFLTETEISSQPTFLCSVVLEILNKKGVIQVIYPKQGLGNLVSSPTSAITFTKTKNTLFLSVFFLVCSQIFSREFRKYF